MKCKWCDGTGMIKESNNKKLFDELVEREMDKSYHVNYVMAAEKVHKKIGYKEIECPYCKELLQKK